MATEPLSIREGALSDLHTMFDLSERAMHGLAVELGYEDQAVPTDDAIAAAWDRHHTLVEFLDAQPERRFVIAENGDGPVAFARVVRFGAMEQLTDLMVAPAHQGGGIGRELLQQIWAGDPSPDLGRIVVASGTARDLSLYTDFGVMPAAGHWHMRQETSSYLERRSHETDATEAGAVVVLTHERAVAEWKRLEPEAIGHERPALHDFFGRDRACLASLDPSGETLAVCWVSTDGDIGPAVGRTAADPIPVILAALDRVAKSVEPEYLSVFASSTSWHLLHRLRVLGFRVYWPSWVMCSVPLPGLDRYVPTRPPLVL